MRILTLLFKYIAVIAVGLTVSGLIAREVLLFWGVQQIKLAENKMEVSAGARLKSEYDGKCREKAGGRAGSNVRNFQVRFTSDKEYQVEAVCQLFSNDPIIIQEYKLPPFVTKVPGQAGLVYDPQGLSGIILEVYKRKTTLLLEGENLRVMQGAHQIAGVQPQATCAGFGYACCTMETEQGEGDVLRQASDCPTTCYLACMPRPSVLKFTSDPNPDLSSRVVNLPKGSAITFYFVTDPGKTNRATTQIQFGDGQFKEFLEEEGNYTHQYQCALVECRFTAQLVVTDPEGVTSVPTALSTINIVVR
jgi:hypothetical protein